MVCSGDQSSSTETQTGGLSVKMVRQAEDRNAYAFFFFLSARAEALLSDCWRPTHL